MTRENHRNHAHEMRRFIDLIESQTATVSVTVDEYAGVAVTPADGSPFPATFQFDVAEAMEKDEVSRGVAVEIEKATGYRPKRIRWRWKLNKTLNPANLH